MFTGKAVVPGDIDEYVIFIKTLHQKTPLHDRRPVLNLAFLHHSQRVIFIRYNTHETEIHGR